MYGLSYSGNFTPRVPEQMAGGQRKVRMFIIIARFREIMNNTTIKSVGKVL